MIYIDHMIKDYSNFHLDISMEIPAGRITGIVGRNGAGKSTTIKAMLGLVKPDSGTVQILGKNAMDLKPSDKEHIGVAFADSGFSLQFNAKDVICILKKMYRDFDENFFREKLREQSIPMDKKIKDYSTGMKAKLRVLVALSHGAQLLILDEPTAGLDVIARKDILDLLRDYVTMDDNRTIIITSHISSDLEELCDEIYLIHNGKIMLHEDTDVILDNYGILHLNEKQYEEIDKQYLLSSKKKDYEYTCFTQDKRFYMENYPGIVVENGKLDDLILLMTGGRR